MNVTLRRKKTADSYIREAGTSNYLILKKTLLCLKHQLNCYTNNIGFLILWFKCCKCSHFWSWNHKLINQDSFLFIFSQLTNSFVSVVLVHLNVFCILKYEFTKYLHVCQISRVAGKYKYSVQYLSKRTWILSTTAL